jgi:hypothetical protein
MRVKLLKDKHYPAAWVMTPPPLKAGTVVPVVPATNQPQNGTGEHIRYWVDTPELRDDAYGIGLYDGDFEVIDIHPVTGGINLQGAAWDRAEQGFTPEQ